MTQSKRPHRLISWIRALRNGLYQVAPTHPAFAEVDSSALGHAMAAMVTADRRTYAVAVCLYKLAIFERVLPLVEQRPASTGERSFDVLLATGEVVSERQEGIGLSELTSYPKGRWLNELRISLVLRLSAAGLTRAEIARLLPDDEHQTPASLDLGSRAIGALLRAHRTRRLRDLAYWPAACSSVVTERISN